MEFVTNSRTTHLGPVGGWIGHKHQQAAGGPPAAGKAPPVSHHMHLGGMVPAVMGSKVSMQDQRFARSSFVARGANEFDVAPAGVSPHAHQFVARKAPMQVHPPPQPNAFEVSFQPTGGLESPDYTPPPSHRPHPSRRMDAMVGRQQRFSATPLSPSSAPPTWVAPAAVARARSQQAQQFGSQVWQPVQRSQMQRSQMLFDPARRSSACVARW